MNLNEYQAAADTTAMHPNKGNNIFYPVLGLIGEFGEVIEAITKGSPDKDILLETGDCLWYLSTVCTELGINLTDIADSRVVDNPTVVLGQIAEVTKKLMRDDNSVVSDKHRELLTPLLSKLFLRVKATVESYGSTIEEVADMNIKKLADRKKRNKLQGSGDYR
ncbi:hypothetical protein KAR91_01420 [Candidatus Pacearchaeota archaeon]|nr:hypothetical protein [Candidatus Pacearchaeota archaeon]